MFFLLDFRNDKSFPEQRQVFKGFSHLLSGGVKL